MKKIIFIIFLSIGVGNIVQAQLLKNIKTKAKTAVNNSVDRSTDKVIDKTINNPADNATDTVLDKTKKKINSLFKRKKKGDPEQNKVSGSDSTTVRPADADSSAIVVSVSENTAIKPKNQN